MIAPTPAVDLLHRAAERLRDPCRCNTDPVIDLAVAAWLADTAELQQIADLNDDDAPAVEHALAVARAVLRDRNPDVALDELRHALREGGAR